MISQSLEQSQFPQLEKSREKRETRPQSLLSNFEVPNYEEICQDQFQPHHNQINKKGSVWGS